MARTGRFPRLTWMTAAVAAVLVAGCAPITTQQEYAPSDGVRAQLGEQVKAENLMVVTSGEGEPGVLLGGVTNLGEQPAAVALTVGAQVIDLPIEPGSTVLLGAASEGDDATLSVTDISIAAVPAPPGALTDLEIATPESGSITVAVPVLDGTLESYEEVVP